MPKVKEVSDYLRKAIIELRGEGMSHRKISAEMNVPFAHLNNMEQPLTLHGQVLHEKLMIDVVEIYLEKSKITRRLLERS